MQLKNYMEQHDKIKSELKVLKKLAESREIENNANEYALHISMLAGKIKIHLMSEDQYMYPSLVKAGDEKTKRLALAYQKEMGDLSANFVQFKGKYNTQNKILENKTTFIADLKQIIDKIEARVSREENELYHLLK